ncbi:MAG: S8 family serine peptidase [Sphingomonadaceae bacterium]|nr:S8 family serine peptidase [Sphingomonadaceae bacterium]
MLIELLELGPDPTPETPGNAPDRFQLIVTYDPGVALQSANGLLNSNSGRFEKEILSSDSILNPSGGVVRVLSFPETAPKDVLIEALSNRPGVQAVELDSVVHIALASSDPIYTQGDLWGTYGPAGDGIGAFSNQFGSSADVAWANANVSADGHVGSMTTVIGVIDTGVDPVHPDLYLNIWINQNEIPFGLAADQDGDGIITFRDLNVQDGGNWVNAVSDINGNGYIDADDILRDSNWANGFDDDSNGFTDDLFGWDFFSNDNRPFESYERGGPGAFEKEPSVSYHGTHVAGTIGALANDIGTAGIIWEVQIMPLRFIGQSGNGFTSDAVAALNYYSALGQVNPGLDFIGTNNSWGGGTLSASLADAITAAGNLGQLFIAAAGNDANDTDSTGHYPSALSLTSTYLGRTFDPVISVAAIDDDGSLSSFSNFGAISVDLGAPGRGIASLLSGNEYTADGSYAYFNLNGTSMAAPHVAGAVALAFAENPGIHPADVRSAVLGSATPTASLSGITVTGGRLNIAGLADLTGPSVAITIDDTELSLADSSATVTFTFSEPVQDFTLTDINVTSTHGSVAGLSSADNTIFTAVFTPANVETEAAQISIGTDYSDSLGNAGQAGASDAFTIDRIAPTAVVSGVVADEGETGVDVEGGLSEALGTDEIVAVYRDGGYIGDADVSGTVWNLIDSEALIDGTYSYTARAIDGIGNEGAASIEGLLIIDSTAPNPHHDFDGDGGDDLLFQTASNGYLFITDGDGGLQAELGLRPIGGVEAIGDFDGDGAQDIAFRYPDGSFYSVKGTGAATHLGNMTGQTLLDVADFDGDGGDDFLFQTASNGYLFITDGDGGLQAELGLRPIGGIEATGDVNGDGAQDIIIRYPDGNVYGVHGDDPSQFVSFGNMTGQTLLLDSLLIA